MEQITVRLHPRTLATLERDARDSDASRSEHVRELLESHHELEDRVDELKAERDRLQERADRLDRQMLLLLEREQETEALVEHVEEQESGGAIERAKRWLFGGD